MKLILAVNPPAQPSQETFTVSPSLSFGSTAS